jgi:DNA-binding MarR family transcriptional regulator
MLPPTLPIDSSVFFKLVRLVNLAARPFVEDIGRQHRLSLGEWRVMVALASHEAVAATQICDLTGMDKMSVSRAIAGLTAAKRVRKATDPGDGRRTLLSLNKAGQALFAQIGPLAMARQESLFAALQPTDIAHLDRLLDSLLDGVTQPSDFE